jgi:hypothetical protein
VSCRAVPGIRVRRVVRGSTAPLGIVSNSDQVPEIEVTIEPIEKAGIEQSQPMIRVRRVAGVDERWVTIPHDSTGLTIRLALDGSVYSIVHVTAPHEEQHDHGE